MIETEHLLTRADCRAAIAGHAYESPAAILHDAALVAPDADRDVYGTGESLNAFERRIAALIGKEAAVFMPSGTMAQQIALRIVADRRALRTFAAHPTTHIVKHERNGYARLHDLHFVPCGSAPAPLTLDDVRAIHEPIGTLLLELPQREIGGELPDWDELVAVVSAARERGWHVHLDGARLWECGPAYGRPYAEIAALFDSVYVSFYKGIGALAGAMLLGTRAFVDEAAIWQRRHGGNLFTLFPYALIAEQCFERRIDRMAHYHAAALRIAAALGAYDHVSIRPTLPRTNMLHAFIRGRAPHYFANAQRVAREHGIWTLNRLTPVDAPDLVMWEIACGDATVDLSDRDLRVALDGLLREDR